MKILWGFIVVMMGVSFSVTGFTNEAASQKLLPDGYFDAATGHKYVRTGPQVYAEYSKRGKLLNPAVPSTKPLLSSNKNIHPITPGSYILYEKRQNPPEMMILPAQEGHPEGWHTSKLLYPPVADRD